MCLGTVVLNVTAWLEDKPVTTRKKDSQILSYFFFELADGNSVEVKQRHIMNTPYL
jgi:hypothetical protein